DNADELMSEDDARRGRVARRVAQDLQVGAADAARLDGEDDVGRAVDARNRPREDLEPAAPCEDGSRHRSDDGRHCWVEASVNPASSSWSSDSSCPPAISRTSCSWSTSFLA